MADLKPRIDQLVGSLSGAGRPGGHPPGRVTAPWPSLRAGDPGFAEAVARLVAMPLDQFARGGQLMEVRVPWLDVTLWFVPEERDAEALGREGVSRERVCTAGELIDHMAMPLRTQADIRTITLAKVLVDGEIVSGSVRSLSLR